MSSDIDSITELHTLVQRTQFNYLESWQRELIADALALVEACADKKIVLADYSVLVFPVSKAYEGFLKQYLRDLGLITQETYESKKFRIGRALNPDISQSQRDEWWYYDDLVQMCGPDLGRQVWNAWLDCRNRLFHYFPAKRLVLTYDEACTSINTLLLTISEAISCQSLHTQLPNEGNYA